MHGRRQTRKTDGVFLSALDALRLWTLCEDLINVNGYDTFSRRQEKCCWQMDAVRYIDRPGTCLWERGLLLLYSCMNDMMM